MPSLPDSQVSGWAIGGRWGGWEGASLSPLISYLATLDNDWTSTGSLFPSFVMIWLQLWLTLAEQYLSATGVDWDQVERDCFSERITGEDEQLGAQILRVSLFLFLV